jgi:hypothetical protein
LFVRLARLILRSAFTVSHTVTSAIAVYAPSTAANTHIIIIIIRRNFNNQSLPLYLHAVRRCRSLPLGELRKKAPD